MLTNDLLKLLSLNFSEKKVEYGPLFESSMNVVCLGDPMMVKGRGMNPVENEQECETSCTLDERCNYFKFVQIVYGTYFGCKLFQYCDTTVDTVLFGRIYRKKG